MAAEDREEWVMLDSRRVRRARELAEQRTRAFKDHRDWKYYRGIEANEARVLAEMGAAEYLGVDGPTDALRELTAPDIGTRVQVRSTVPVMRLNAHPPPPRQRLFVRPGDNAEHIVIFATGTPGSGDVFLHGWLEIEAIKRTSAFWRAEWKPPVWMLPRHLMRPMWVLAELVELRSVRV